MRPWQRCRERCCHGSTAQHLVTELHGPAIVGNFGGGRFFDYTAYNATMMVTVMARAHDAHCRRG